MNHLWRSDRLLTLLVLLLPTYQIRWSFFGIPTTMLEIGIYLLSVVVFIQEYQTRRSLRSVAREFVRLDRPALAIAIAAVIASVTAAAVFSPQPTVAAGLWKAYLADGVIAFFLVRRIVCNHPLPVRLLARSGSILLVILTGIAVFQYIQPMGIPIGANRLFAIPDPLWSARETFRAVSAFDYPNAVGLLAAPLTALAGATLALWGFAWIPAIGFFAGLLLITLANSNGAMLAVTFGAMSLIVLPRLSDRWRLILLPAAGLLFVILPLLPLHSWLLPMVDTSPSSVLRLEQYDETQQLLRRHPVMGSGLGNYPSAIVDIHNTQLSGKPFLYPHNMVLSLWSEFGIAGLLAFGLLIALTLRQLLRRLDFDPSTVVLTSAWLSLISHGLVDVPYFKNDLAVLFWILVALSWPAIKSNGTITPAIGSGLPSP